MLEPVTSRDRCVRGRSLGRTESSLTFGRHPSPPLVKTILREWGTAVDVPPARVAARKHRRPNEGTLGFANSSKLWRRWVATLHHRREGIGPSADGAAEAEMWEEGSPASRQCLSMHRGLNAGSRFRLDQPTTSAGRHPDKRHLPR